MNLESYHRSWMQGFSEKECCMRAEDAWEQEQYDKLEQERLDREYEQEYYASQHKQDLEEE